MMRSNTMMQCEIYPDWDDKDPDKNEGFYFCNEDS